STAIPSAPACPACPGTPGGCLAATACRLLLLNSGAAARLDQRQGAQHLIDLDHQRLVAAEARLRQQEARPGGEPDLGGDAGGLVGLVAAAAEAAAHALLAGVKHGLDRIVDPAEI